MRTPAAITLAKARRDAREGFIVVAVLWILGALATLASIYAVYVVDTATAFAVHDDRLQAEALVSAGLELTAYQLTAPAEQGRPSVGAFAFRIGQANVAVEFRSEAGRIDLNAAPKELLGGLFASLGARPNQAEYYADRIVGWRTAPPEGQDSEASAYRTAGLKYPPRGGRFQHTGELSLVLGLPPALVERAMPFVTVYSGQAGVNALAAPPEVVAALPGMTPERLYAFLAQRRTAPQNAQILLTILGPAQGSATVEASKAARVTVRTIFDNGRRMSSEAVIVVFEDAPEPYRVLSWHDELDEPLPDDRSRTVLR
jgi:general secretion pathway protein K